MSCKLTKVANKFVGWCKKLQGLIDFRAGGQSNQQRIISCLNIYEEKGWNKCCYRSGANDGDEEGRANHQAGQQLPRDFQPVKVKKTFLLKKILLLVKKYRRHDDAVEWFRWDHYILRDGKKWARQEVGYRDAATFLRESVMNQSKWFYFFFHQDFCFPCK